MGVGEDNPWTKSYRGAEKAANKKSIADEEKRVTAQVQQRVAAQQAVAKRPVNWDIVGIPKVKKFYEL